MMKQKVGVLHPGQMGISVAASAQNSGHDVYWASEGRSPQTCERAAKFNLHDAHTLAKLCETCSIIVSVCPPHAAEDVAHQVLDCSFAGLYLDANAISPLRQCNSPGMVQAPCFRCCVFALEDGDLPDKCQGRSPLKPVFA